MKTTLSPTLTRALTHVEVLAVLGACGTLVFAFLAAVTPEQPRRSQRINCVSNLKQIGLAMRMWANDNGDQFPWEVALAKKGTLELADSPDVYRHFLAVSNELNSPKILACPTDTKVTRVTDWPSLGNTNLSYFIGLDADESRPQSILSGDRNITGGQFVTNRVMRFTKDSPASWGADLHEHEGNIALGDGSALQLTTPLLRKQIQSTWLGGASDLRVSIPTPK